MTDYSYRCGSCDLETELDCPMGEAPRIIRCPDCFGIAQQILGRGLFIGAGALPNKRAGVLTTMSKDDRLSEDLTAYHRMRHRGLQPNNINGAAAIENTVEDNFDITYGKFYGRAKTREEARTRIKEGLEEAHELGEQTGNEWLKKNAKPVA